MTDESDRGLHEQFQALRREAARGTPAFGAMLAAGAAHRAPPARTRRRVVGITVALAAILVLGTLVRRSGHRAAPVGLVTARWEAPTDFLLRAPGAELLRTVPTFTLNERLLP
ncbi:MAG TPA: hypothetical protein VH158_09160 [Gemmatimonadales bacterium]|jgi:hypothetical protein|nr:hypothetical protein [Gemmatimonadales bacterium]